MDLFFEFSKTRISKNVHNFTQGALSVSLSLRRLWLVGSRWIESVHNPFFDALLWRCCTQHETSSTRMGLDAARGLGIIALSGRS